MVKGTIRQTIGAAAIAVLLPLLCVSCSEDGISTASIGGDGNTVTVGITVQASYGYDEDGKYETGSEYENYLDITGGDYRIYFFTTDNTFIAQFTPVSVIPVESSNYTEYTMMGEVPDALLQYADFKVMVLANWGTYDDDIDSTYHINDICESSTATFDHLTDFELSPSSDPKRLIPFYGIHAYTDITFKANQAIVLPSPITMLRAMAKVEVLLDNKVATFTDVSVHRYNDKGYCAPDNTYYSEEDYDHGYSYDNDFTSGVHLIGGANDTDTEDKTLTFLKTKDRIIDEETGDITQYETWIAYLPEYENTSDDEDDYSYITVKLNYQSSTAEPYIIYFAKYGDDGTSENAVSDRYDIQRNNLYRYTVSLTYNFIRVVVNKWTAVYENEFDFIASGSSDD